MSMPFHTAQLANTIQWTSPVGTAVLGFGVVARGYGDRTSHTSFSKEGKEPVLPRSRRVTGHRSPSPVAPQNEAHVRRYNGLVAGEAALYFVGVTNSQFEDP